MFITERKSVPKRWRWWRRRWRQRRLQGALERSINTMLTLLAHAFSHRQCNVSSLGNKRSANLLLLSRRSMMVSKQLAWTTWPSLCASPHTMYFPMGRSCELILGFKGATYLGQTLFLIGAFKTSKGQGSSPAWMVRVCLSTFTHL